MTEQMAIKELEDYIDLPFGISISDETCKIAIEAIKERQQYRAIGTVEDCENYKRGCVIANVTFDKETLQEIVNEKIKEVELDINAIRTKAIEEFLSEICKKYTEEERKGNYQYCCVNIKNDIAEIAESMKGEKE